MTGIIKTLVKGFVYSLAILLAIAFVGSFIFGMGSEISETNAVSASTPTVATPITTEDIKNAALPISYDDLMRNSDDHIGEVIYKRGEILQVSERRTDKYVLRVATLESTYGYYEDIIWVEYEGNRLLEGDIIDVWGESKGIETYSALLGNQVTIPKIDSLHAELVTKAGNNR